MRFAARIVLLAALWILAWGELSAANLASGVAVALVLLVAFPPHASGVHRLRIRPAGVLRLGAHVGGQLLAANVVMTREILRRRSTMAPGVVHHRLRYPSEHVVTVMTSIISLSPGTMTVDVGDDADAIAVHFLFLHDVDGARASLEHLEHLTIDAIGGAGPQPGAT